MIAICYDAYSRFHIVTDLATSIEKTKNTAKWKGEVHSGGHAGITLTTPSGLNDEQYYTFVTEMILEILNLFNPGP